MKMARTRSYKQTLEERLANPKEAAAYLNAALEDADIRVFLVALRDVVDAYGGISALAEETDLNRESLYRTLSRQGNPTIVTLFEIFHTLGLQFKVQKAV
jgi:probable addiction module antidote protein